MNLWFYDYVYAATATPKWKTGRSGGGEKSVQVNNYNSTIDTGIFKLDLAKRKRIIFGNSEFRPERKTKKWKAINSTFCECAMHVCVYEPC